MEITFSFSPESLQELRKAGRRWPYRPVQFVGNFRVAAFILGAFAFALRSFYLGFRTSPMDQDSILNGIIIVSIIAVFIAILKYRERARAKRDAASKQPFQLVFDHTGFTSHRVSTSPRYYPWSQFASFTYGNRIVIFSAKDKKSRMAIPVDNLTSVERAELRSILLSHLPEKI